MSAAFWNDYFYKNELQVSFPTANIPEIVKVAKKPALIVREVRKPFDSGDGVGFSPFVQHVSLLIKVSHRCQGLFFGKPS